MEKSRVEHWIRIPDKSKLKVVVTGTTDKQTVDARLDWMDGENNGTPLVIDTATGKPTFLTLRTPKKYSADIVLTFQTDAKASVTVEVLHEDGSPHSDAYATEITAKAKAVEFVALFLFTLQS